MRRWRSGRAALAEARRALAWLVVGMATIVPGAATAQGIDPGDVSIYSTSSGGGALTTDNPLLPSPLFPSVCLGGSCLFSSTDPGFITREEAPGAGLFPLTVGTSVAMEIVSIADEVSVLVGSKLLDEPGETATLGTAPGLHVHPTWQVTLPASGAGATSFDVTFHLTAAAPYASSASYSLALTIPGPSPSATPLATPSPTAATATPAPSASPTAGTPTPAVTPRPSATPAGTGSPAPTPAPPTPSPSSAPAPTPTSVATSAPTPAGTPRPTVTPRPTPSGTVFPTVTPAATPSPTPRPTPSSTARATRTPTPTTEPPGVVRQEPSSRGDQVLYYLDARPGFTTFLSVANVGGDALDVRVDFHASDLSPSHELLLALPAGGSRTIDVGELRDEGLVAGPGLAIASAVDAAGEPLVTRALAGNFTVANLALGSAWGAPGVARSARLAAGGETPARGTHIDGDAVVLEQIRPDAVELAVYHDPATLEDASEGGNQLIFVSFDDASGRAPDVAGAAMRWVVSATRSDGGEIDAAALDTSGVEASHLAAIVGPEVLGAAGHLELVARTPSAGNRLVFFAQSLGTFATGYLLPPAR